MVETFKKDLHISKLVNPIPPNKADHKMRGTTPAYIPLIPSLLYISLIPLIIGVPLLMDPAAILVLSTSNGVLQADEQALATAPAIKYKCAGAFVVPDCISSLSSSYNVNLTTADGIFFAKTTRKLA